MDAVALRGQFPVLERTAYLNSGTDGPLPEAALAAAREAIADAGSRGRVTAHFERRLALQDELRGAYARMLSASPDDVALTTSTTDGIGRVIAGLDLGPDDEIVTSDQEHPGVVGPLLAARRRGVNVRVVPFAQVAEAVRPETTLVAVSHVSWIGGEVAPAALSELDVPVILDGAQGAGAIHVDPAALGCVAYAAAGPEVALRGGRDRAALDRPGVRGEGRARHSRLRLVRGRVGGLRGRVQGDRGALRRPGAPARGRRVVGRGDARARAGRLAGARGARGRAGAPARGPAARVAGDR